MLRRRAQPCRTRIYRRRPAEPGSRSRRRVARGHRCLHDRHRAMEPNSRVRLIASRAGEHRMALDHGQIRALIWAPPQMFFVNTPSSTAIDLGCAYTLRVDERGWGKIHVESGWVAFEHKGRESFSPQTAMCTTRPGVGQGRPLPGRRRASRRRFAILDFSPAQDIKAAEALDTIGERPPKDALTVASAVARVAGGARRAYDRLPVMVPACGANARSCPGGDRARSKDGGNKLAWTAVVVEDVEAIVEVRLTAPDG